MQIEEINLTFENLKIIHIPININTAPTANLIYTPLISTTENDNFEKIFKINKRKFVSYLKTKNTAVFSNGIGKQINETKAVIKIIKS